MFHLLYFVESNKEYQKLINFSHIERDIYGITYLTFYEEVRCKNGRIFQVHNDLLIAVSFITHLLDLKKLKETMVKAGLNLDSLVNYFDLEFDLDDDEIENIVYDIHDLAFDLMERENLEVIILTPNNGYAAFFGSEDEEAKCNKIITQLS